MVQVKTYYHRFFRNSLIAGAADVNVIEFRNIEGGKRRKLLTLSNHIIAVDNVTGLQQAVTNYMPAAALYVSPFIRIQEIFGGAVIAFKFPPEVITPAAGVGNGTGQGLHVNINQKTYFADLSFQEGLRVTCEIQNNLPANDIYYAIQIYAEIEIQ